MFFAGIPHPRLRQGDTRAFLRQEIPAHSFGLPHPTRASVGRCSCASAGIPPAGAFVGIPRHFCRPPPPRSRLRQGIPGYLAGPPPPAPAAGIPGYLAGTPHPSRAFVGIPRHFPGTPTPPAPAALLPRPQRGAWAVRGDIRGAAVSGVEPAGNRIWGGAGGKPYPGWSRREIVSGVEPAGNRIRGGAGGKPYPG